MKNCPKKNCLISVLAVIIFMMAYNYVVHQVLLKPDYAATASLWRTPEDMKNFCGGWIAYYVIFAMVVTCFFKKFRKATGTCHCGPECACGPNCPCKIAVADAKSCCPIKSGGACFGLKLGLIMGLNMGITYFYMPIPMDLAIKWFFTGLVEGLGIGIVLGMVCKGKSSSCDATKSA